MRPALMLSLLCALPALSSSTLLNSQNRSACPLSGGSVLSELRISGDLALLASYRAQTQDAQGHEANWTGDLQALFVDAQGWLREDGDGDAQLGSHAQDPAVSIEFDSSAQRSLLRRYQGPPELGLYERLPYESLRPIWSAARMLAAISDTQTQRAYASQAAQRYLFTAIDRDRNGEIGSSEQQPLLASSFREGLYGILDIGDAARSEALIAYVRGQAVPGMRARELLQDGSLQTQRLGMIETSAPLLVAAPAEQYDRLYADSSYASFVQRYRQRRRVAYVGAADGLLHAFDAGFAPADGESTPQRPGRELWAYAPYALLPHLGELARETAPEQAVVAGTPMAFDAAIFADDVDHPGGWGTVLAVGLRLGGGGKSLSLRSAPAAFAGFAAAADTLITRPSLLLIDISNPEQAPQLIAELSEPELGYTLAQPAVLRLGGRWFLLFGSGPDERSSASASGNARLYVYDLQARRYVSGYRGRDLGAHAARSFIGTPVSVDWNLDFSSDSAYFGTVSGDALTPGGRLLRLDFHDSSDPTAWTLHSVLDAGRPLLDKPAPRLDAQQQRWLYLGSGRLLVDADAGSRAAQALIGLIDRGNASLTAAQLFDSSLARLDRSEQLSGITGPRSLRELRQAVAGSGGWRVDLALGNSAERSTAAPLLAANTVFMSTALPQLRCLATQRRLQALDADTGAARLDSRSDGFSRDALSLGAGPPARPSLQAVATAAAASAAPVAGELKLMPGGGATPADAPLAAGKPLPRSGEIERWELHP